MMGQALHMGNFIVMEYNIKRDRVTNRHGNLLPADGLTLQEFTERIHADQRQEFIQKTKSLLEGRERQFELDKRWNAGTADAPHWLNFQGHAICELDSDGRPAYIVNAIQDVTQEMEEDHAERNLVHKYQVLTNLPFVAMSFYDKDGYLYSINDTMKELCAIDRDSEAQHFWENVSMYDIPLMQGMISPNSKDGVSFCQHFEYPEFGLNKYIDVSIQPLFNAEGDLINYLCTTFDVTRERDLYKKGLQLAKESRQTQQEIALRKDRLHYLLAHSERYLMRSSIHDERISFFRTPDKPEYQHSFSRFQRILAKEDREPVTNILYDNKTRTPQTYTIHISEPSEGQSGTVFVVTFNPITNDQGEIIGHEGIASDITCITRTSSQLAEETLLAEESLRMKSAFMASMTHELRTPLNAIIGFTSVMESLGDSPERGEYVRIIHNSTDMLQRLINDIIEASSITYGSFTIKPEETDFALAFDDICMTLAQRVQNPHVEFQKDSPFDHFLTNIDIGRIQQVLTNFVTNAVKFTNQGHIRLGWKPKDNGLYLYCEDTGKGIPADKQALVFEQFVKLDEFVQGTGMGLAICKTIAERCGGKIGVTSEGEGKGSTFWLWVP
jgi:signal transduction histidine kinase/PAS domain-containing protein